MKHAAWNGMVRALRRLKVLQHVTGARGEHRFSCHSPAMQFENSRAGWWDLLEFTHHFAHAANLSMGRTLRSVGVLKLELQRAAILSVLSLAACQVARAVAAERRPNILFIM